MDALSDANGSSITKGLEAKTTSKTMEQRLRERISQGQSHQRKKALDDAPRMDDDCARDGFFPQQQIKKLPLPTLDLSIKQTMKIHLKDTSSFRRIKSVDWARAAAQIKPETDVQELTTASTYYIWPTKLTESVYPRYGRNDFVKGVPEYESEWIQFQQTISSLFSGMDYKNLKRHTSLEFHFFVNRHLWTHIKLSNSEFIIISTFSRQTLVH